MDDGQTEGRRERSDDVGSGEDARAGAIAPQGAAEGQKDQQEPQETYEGLAARIEHVLLAPELTDDDLYEGCRIAEEYGVAAVVVRPADVEQAVRFTRNRIPVATAVGYPDGSSTTAAKLYEGRDLLRRGAREIEMLPNIGKLLSRQFQYIETELMQMAKSCLEEGVTFKVSLGRFALPDDLKIITLKIAKRIEAAYFSLPYQPASLALLTPLLKERISLRAAGGVINLDLALQARDGGCARIATAQTAAILDAWKSKLAPKEVEQGTDASPGNGMIS